MAEADAPEPRRRTERLLPVVRLLGGYLLAVLAVAAATLPISVERGIENAVVRETIGVVPATLTLTGTSNSRLELGIVGSLTLPLARGPFGVRATVDGPPATVSGSEAVASYFSPELVQVYSGLFHDADAATQAYVDEIVDELLAETFKAMLVFSLPGGLAVLLLLRVLDPRLRDRLRRHRAAGVVLALVGGFVISGAVSWVEFRQWPGSQDPPRTAYSLPTLNGTAVEGAVTDSALLRLAIEDAIPKIRSLVDRQDAQTERFIASASDQLELLSPFVVGPRSNEVAVMMQSDMHCNAAMIDLQRRVVQLLNERYGEGTVSLLAITGDHTTNGTAAEGTCIRREAAIAEGAPIASVAGNHESELTSQQMRDAGMTVLEGETQELGGVRVLGDEDPARTELFGPTRLRGEVTQEDVGAAMYERALEDEPQLVLAHEGYAIEAFLGEGVDDMRAFLEDRGSATEPWEDGIRDLPASAVFYGHWHRDVPPRVVWNSDGTWTLVMELNTSGGAIATPTIGRFSTPWSAPQQRASFPVVFLDRETGLVTGYQRYVFDPDGTVEVEPLVTIGRSAVTIGPAADADGELSLPSPSAR